MRFVAIALVLAFVGCSGCKDKQAAKQEPAPATAPQAPGAAPELEMPNVTGPGLVKPTKLGPKIAFGKTAILLDGESVVTIGPDGMLDSARLDTLTRLLETKATSDAPIAIELDSSITYQRVGQLLDRLKRAGFRNLALVAGPDAVIPIELPDTSEANAGGVRPIVTLDHNRLVLWSASGEEGTKKKPKLVLTIGGNPSDFQPLTRALSEIVSRRWPSGKRSPEDRTIIVQLDPTQPASTLLLLLAAVRAEGGRELFPNIFLAGGV
jgi:hypothetical protein